MRTTSSQRRTTSSPSRRCSRCTATGATRIESGSSIASIERRSSPATATRANIVGARASTTLNLPAIDWQGFEKPVCVRREVHRLSIDHVLPTSRGGPWTWDNLVVACQECNTKKGDFLSFSS